MAITSAHSTISLAGISSGPDAFLVFNPFKSAKTSSTLRTISDNEGWSIRLEVGKEQSEWSVKMDWKCLEKAITLSRSDVTSMLLSNNIVSGYDRRPVFSLKKDQNGFALKCISFLKYKLCGSPGSSF